MGFFDKLKKINIFSTLAHLGSELNDDFYDELEESLILADTGMDVTLELVAELRRRVRAEGIKTLEAARACMCRVIADAMNAAPGGEGPLLRRRHLPGCRCRAADHLGRAGRGGHRQAARGGRPRRRGL